MSPAKRCKNRPKPDNVAACKLSSASRATAHKRSRPRGRPMTHYPDGQNTWGPGRGPGRLACIGLRSGRSKLLGSAPVQRLTPHSQALPPGEQR